MPPQKPLRHQPKFTRERLTVIGTKLCRGLASANLDIGQYPQSISIEALRVVPGIEPRKVVCAPKVLEQHESTRDIGLVHMRNVRAQRFEEPSHLQVGAY